MASISVEGRTAYLGNHPTFAQLSYDQRHAIASLMGEHRCRAGETLFLAGDPADRLYIIVSGNVRISRLSEEGREMLLNVMRTNDMFGEIALLDNKARTASAVTVNECHLLSLAREPFLRLVSSNGSLALGIIAVLVERVRHMSELIHNVSLRPVEARIASVILLLADRHGRRGAEGISIELKINQTDIGAFAGATRPTVNKVMKQLERQGVIGLPGHSIVVKDRNALDRAVHAAPILETRL